MKLVQIEQFRRIVWEYYVAHARHDLPWRKTRNPYRILVSEVMLQQTQVPRVIEKYKEFLKAFPTVKTLAQAPLSDVLKVWSGLGYNRRAKYLRDCAKLVITEYKGNLKTALQYPLPGVGPYTRAAVRTFAFNESHSMIETNIRTVFIHHFFSSSRTTHDREQDGRVGDGEILQIVQLAAEGQDPREWYWALMDYGSYLKLSGVRNNAESTHYKKQSEFKGSLRQVRGEILKTLSSGTPINDIRCRYKSGKKNAKIMIYHNNQMMTQEALKGLKRDGLVVKEKGKWRIA